MKSNAYKRCDHEWGSPDEDGFVKCRKCGSVGKADIELPPKLETKKVCPVCYGRNENRKYMIDGVCYGCGVPYYDYRMGTKI